MIGLGVKVKGRHVVNKHAEYPTGYYGLGGGRFFGSYNMNIKFTLWLFVLLAMPSAFAADAPSLSFCIPPQQSPIELTKRWTPVLQYLSEKSGVLLGLKTAKDIPTYQQLVMDEQCDFAYMSPNSYIAANKAGGYQAFAKDKDAKSIAIIVVRKDGPIQRLAQLKDQTLAFPSHTAFMATILPMQKLDDEKIAVKKHYVVSMDSVYRSVAKGLFVAGGGEARTFGSLDPEIRSQLDVLWKSDEFPPFPFFAHPRVKTAALIKLQKAMLAMSQDPQGQALLKVVNIKTLDIAGDSEYDGVRRLNLPLEVK